MRCLKCHRALTRFAFSVETADGVKGWGPDCAKAIGLAPPKKPRAKSYEDTQRDALTRDWVEELGAAA